MPDFSVQHRTMGAWWFETDSEGQVQELRVSFYFNIGVEGSQGEFVTRGGQDIDIWPLLPQGKKTQIQSVVDGVLILMEEI